MSRTDLTRRRMIGALGAAGVAGLAGCGGDGDGDGDGDTGDGTTAGDGTGGDGTTEGTEDGDGTTTAPEASGEVTVGIVQPLSGDLQYYGQSALYGFYSGLKYKGGDAATVPTAGDGPGEYEVSVGDVDYTLHVGDSAGDSGQAQNLATEQVNNNGADVLFGAASSASAESIATNVATESAGNVPYMVGPAASVSITGSSETCGPNVFRASENVAMDARSGGTYVAEETDIGSVWIYFADYSFGQSVKDNYQRVLEDNGVSVEGTTPLAADYSDDWPGQFSKATNAGVDGIIGGFTVAALPSMVGTFLANDYDFRFIGGFTTLAGATALGDTLENELGELTAENIDQSGLGPLTTRYHWNQYDNDVNDAFTDIYSERYGTYPDLFTGGTFTGATAIHEAMQNEGEVSSDAIRAGLTGLSVQDTPKGEGGYEFQEHNNQARSAMTVAPMVPTENQDLWSPAIQPGEPLATYDKSVTTLPADSDLLSCSL